VKSLSTPDLDAFPYTESSLKRDILKYINATFKHPTSFEKNTKELEMAMRILDDEKLCFMQYNIKAA
jgi:hypothetical protein